MARSQQARIAVWGAALIASTAVVLWLARLLNRNSKLAGVAGMAVGLASLALSFWQLGLALRQRHANEPSAAGRSGVGNDILEQAARHLVGRIQTQWKHQENRRRVRDPYPLAVRWHTSEELRDHWVNIRRSPPGAVAGPLALDGRLEHITAVYRRIPSGRLVILGKPGAGKTILTLRFVLDWLNEQPGASHHQVPVIFNLSSWNPATTSLRDWMCQQLLRDHPGLAAPGADGNSVASGLLDAQRILPVLDGFDEIAPRLHRAAREALNADPTAPLLLTSRTDEYRAVVQNIGVISAAAVIVLDDLTVSDLADYLPRTTQPAPGSGQATITRWDPVLAQLHDHPDQPTSRILRTALSNPLMVFLARTIYSEYPDTAGRDPSKLLDTSQFATATAVEDHLLDTFVSAVYQRRPPVTIWDHRQRDPDRARRYLTTLARYRDPEDSQEPARELGWWQLRDGIGCWERMLVLSAIGAVVAPAIFVFAPWFSAGIGAGVGAGVSVNKRGPQPSAVPLRLAGGRILITNSCAGALGASVGAFGLARLLPWSALSHRATSLAGLVPTGLAGVTFGLGIGLVLGLLDSFAKRRDQASGTTTAPRRQAKPLPNLAFGFGAAVIGSVAFGPPSGFAFGLLGGLAAAVIGSMEAPLELSKVPDPFDSLRQDRRSTLMKMVLFGLVVGLPAGLLLQGHGGWRTGLLLGTAAGAANAIAVGFGMNAWGHWMIISRLWLPVTGRLPRDLIRFLKDAHERGVLRQAGAVYQFRHTRLQDTLAASDSNTRAVTHSPDPPRSQGHQPTATRTP